MRFMFSTMVSNANELSKYVDSGLKTNSEMNMSNLCSRYTIDVIGSCAFGVECNSIWDPETEIRKMAIKPFTVSKLKFAEKVILGLNQNLAKFMGVRYQHHDVTDFFKNLVKDTVSYRETNAVQRNDLMSHLIDLKDSQNEKERLTIDEMAAQTLSFFLAGYETTSNTITFALYHMAKDKMIQNQARREIVSVLEKHNGQLTYDALKEMTYVEMIINGR